MREYRIYPTLLDKWTDLCNYRREVEQPWNVVTDGNVDKYPGKVAGDYILNEDEMYDKLERDLLDAVNRVPHAPSPAADKGTAFNEVVDLHVSDEVMDSNCTEIVVGRAMSKAQINGAWYEFSNDLVGTIAKRLKGSLCQHYLEAAIESPYYRVTLYGYCDYFRRGNIIDLKTTKSYEYGNYADKWQRYVYPYCAIESGAATEVEQFEFLIVEWRGGKKEPAKGNIYSESYAYNHADARRRLLTVLDGFTSWLDRNRNKITNQKIFNYKTSNGI